MGFSSALQGKSAHDALLLRQDAELRLLEVMKRCLLQKVKCDKEYAIALTAAAQHGLKIDRVDDLQGNFIHNNLIVTCYKNECNFMHAQYTMHRFTLPKERAEKKNAPKMKCETRSLLSRYVVCDVYFNFGF